MPTHSVNAAKNPSVEQQLSQTLDQWQHWQCEKPLSAKPTIAGALGGGQSNHTFLTAGEQPCVVRIDGVNPQKHGLQRKVEWRCLQAAHEAGIAPAPVYFNPCLGSMVCTYLRPDQELDTTQSPEIAATARLLQRIHRLPARRHRLNHRQRIHQYAQQLGNTQADQLVLGWLPDIEAVLGELRGTQDAAVLCHNDLLDANRLWHGGKLYAIDWEYAAMANPLYDLAVVIEGDRLTEAAATALVSTYLEREPQATEIAALARYRVVYLYLEMLWYCLQEREGATPQDFQATHFRIQKQLALLRAL